MSNIRITRRSSGRYRIYDENDHWLEFEAAELNKIFEMLYTMRDKLRGKDDEPDEEERLHLLMQASMRERVERLDRNPYAVDGKRMSYAEAQRRRLCPECGDQGIPYGDQDFEDQDFDRYQCSNLHVFYVSKEAQA